MALLIDLCRMCLNPVEFFDPCHDEFWAFIYKSFIPCRLLYPLVTTY